MKNEKEYHRMAKVEGVHWWYRTLHHLVLNAIKEKSESLDLNILDAACGTGGLLEFLAARGYLSLKGFDISKTAVELASLKTNHVVQLDARDVAAYFEPESFDIIVCNDMLYYLSLDEQKKLLLDFGKLLRPNGRLIMNLPALAVFQGTHDMVVGISERFSKIDLKRIFTAGSYEIRECFYWPFLLAPFILAVRTVQRLCLRFGIMAADKVRSDVALPPAFFNSIFYHLSRLETTFCLRGFFGSSLFVVAEKLDVKP